MPTLLLPLSPLPSMPISTFDRLVAKVAGKVPIRTVLIVPFVLQIVGTVGLVGYLSYRHGHKTVHNLSSQLHNQISSRIYLHLETYLQTPHLLNQVNENAIKQGLIKPSSLGEIESFFFRQMQSFNSIPYTAWGNEKGEYVGIDRLPNGTLHIEVVDNPQNPKFYTYAVNSIGERGKLLQVTPFYDPRTRPWYKNAVAKGNAIWSPIYVWFNQAEIAIDANLPVYDEKGVVLGVLDTPIKLSRISDYLQKLKVSPLGQSFVMERSGLLIASSSDAQPFTSDKDNNPQRIKASESSNKLIKSTANYLNRYFTNLDTIKKSNQLEFKENHQTQFIQILPFQDGRGIDWLIVVIIPEADFMEEINNNNRSTLLLCIVALIGSTTIGIITAGWITKPILRLNIAAKDIAKGKWYKTVGIERSDEVGELAKSFNNMAEQLQQSFTELKSLNEALAQSEGRLNQILEAMPVGVYVYDINRQVIYANHTSKNLLGIDALPEAETEQLAEAYHLYQSGKNQLYPGESLPIIRSLKGEKVRIEDIEIRLPDRTVPLEVYSTPLFDESGKIIAAIATSFDISDRKKAEKILADYNHTLETQVTERTAELVQTNAKLEQEICDRKQAEIALQHAKEAAEAANRAKSVFLANMSHELRTPLNGILGYAQILQWDEDCTPAQKDGVDIIYQCSEHLLTLIEDVLDISKIEAEKLELYPKQFDFTSFLTGLTEIFHLKAKEKSIVFTYFTIQPIPSVITADEKRLRQVLMNLLSNAIKFTNSGSVTFTVRLVGDLAADDAADGILVADGIGDGAADVIDKVSVGGNSERETNNPSVATSVTSVTKSVAKSAAKIRFQVEDTGMGIAPEDLDKIFLPFEQVGDNSRHTEGTGLGLSITQKLISLMGSEIFVESVPKVGSKFWFDLDL